MHETREAPGNLTPQESLNAIYGTMDRMHSSLYLAGTATILLLWGVICSVGFIAQYTIATLAVDFADTNPWFPGALWGALGLAGMAGSSLIGHRAGRHNADGDAARQAGIRVFLFWMAIVLAAFLLPGAAGLWAEGTSGASIQRIVLAIISLGWVLFGIMHRPAIAVVGVGIAAAYFIPSYLLGDAAALVSGLAMLAVAVSGALWVRRSGLP